MKTVSTFRPSRGARAYVVWPLEYNNGRWERGDVAHVLRVDGRKPVTQARTEATRRAAVFGWSGFALYFNEAMATKRNPLAIGFARDLSAPENTYI